MFYCNLSPAIFTTAYFISSLNVISVYENEFAWIFNDTLFTEPKFNFLSLPKA
jgi:hypothetical protein